MASNPHMENLYTARYHVLKGLPVPDGGPRNSLLAELEKILGPAPASLTGRPVYENHHDPPTVEIPAAITVDWLVPAGNPFPIVGRAFQNGRLEAYLNGVTHHGPKDWKPSRICLHHTASPSLKQRPEGLTEQHIRNLRDFYKDEQGWNSGPHWFVDDRQAWAFTPMTMKGVHAVSFNGNAVGIEMLGDYDSEDPTTGRGRLVLDRTLALVRLLMRKYGISRDGILFHRDDPKTSKTCPGRKIGKDWFLSQL